MLAASSTWGTLPASGIGGAVASGQLMDFGFGERAFVGPGFDLIQKDFSRPAEFGGSLQII